MSNNQQEQEFELTEFEATCKVCKDSFTYCSKNNIKWEEEYEICNDCEEEEEEKELPEDLKEWVLKNMKAVEEHTHEDKYASWLFIKFLEENQHNPTFIKLYDEYEKSKN